MRFFKYFLIPFVTSAMALASCGTEENEESKAILAGDSEIVVPAAAATRTVTIYADGSWIADVTDSWLDIEPTSGFGTVDITLTVDENFEDAPREAQIIIRGSSALDDVEISVRQKNDRFREVTAKTVTEALSLKDGDLVKLSECQIMALSPEGFVVSDGTSNLLILGSDSSLKAGTRLTLTGDAVTYGDLVAVQLEDAFALSEDEVSYPEAVDVTETENYAPGKVEYISATVSFATGGVLNIDGRKFASLFNNTDDFNTQYTFHKVFITGYYIGTADGLHSIMSVSIADKGLEAIPYLQFEIGTDAFKTANSKFSETHSFNSSTGTTGYIKYVTSNLEGSDPDGVFKMDISGNDPRCTGPWEGDYWDIVGSTAVKANTEFRVQFGARVSASGPKYWTLEYLDGTVWNPAGTVKTADITTGKITYTHSMNADGNTNIIVDEAFKITKNMDQLNLRFRCMSSWRANDKGVLQKRNTGSARLSVNSGASSTNKVTAPQPSILITEMGDGNATVDPEPEYADIKLSAELLTFEGTPDAAKTLTVTSDHDFTASANVDWLSLSETEGAAGEAVDIIVTCEPSELSTLREGKITIVSGDSSVDVYVVQSAAGGELDPLISISSGNTIAVLGQGADFEAKVQANVSFETEISADWITAVPTASTQAVVETRVLKFNAAPNLTGVARTGTIRFYKDNIESVLTVSQDKFEPTISVVPVGRATISGLGTTLKYKISSNVDFTVSSSESWVSLPVSEAKAGEYEVPVTFAANAGAEARTATVTFRNAEYSYEYPVVLKQFAAGVILDEDFSWVAPYAHAYNAAHADAPIGDFIASGLTGANAPAVSSLGLDFVNEASARGYSEAQLKAGSSAMFIQGSYETGWYFKFGKKSINTGLALASLDADGTVDVKVTFKWAAHYGGTFKLDAANPCVKIEGSGKIEDGVSDTESKAFTTSQKSYPEGADKFTSADHSWTESSVVIRGIKADTKFSFVPSSALTYTRFHFGGLKVEVVR